jgi:hypothetical protein
VKAERSRAKTDVTAARTTQRKAEQTAKELRRVQIESKREHNRNKIEKTKIGTWSLRILPKHQSMFDKAVNTVLEIASEEYHMVELDDDLEFCTVTGIQDEAEQNTLQKNLERELPKQVEVIALGRVSAASIKRTSESMGSQSMSSKDMQRVDKLEQDMKLVKTDLVEVKSLQSDMSVRMEKMQNSIDHLGDRKAEEKPKKANC